MRNPHYWGRKAKLDRLVFRTISDRQERLDALERGTIDGLDAFATAPSMPSSATRVEAAQRPRRECRLRGHQPVDTAHEQAARPAGASPTGSIALESFARSTGMGQLADQFLPPVFVGHAKHVKQYHYDPARAQRLLRKAGLQLPVKVDFWYPTHIFRAIHARSGAQLRRLCEEPRQGGLQGRPAQRSVIPITSTG